MAPSMPLPPIMHRMISPTKKSNSTRRQSASLAWKPLCRWLTISQRRGRDPRRGHREAYWGTVPGLRALAKGTLQVGADADVTLIDTQTEYVVDRREFRSKSRNSPFHGWTLKGRAVMTICAGKVAYSRVPERITYVAPTGGDPAPAGAEGGQHRARTGRRPMNKPY